MSDTTVPKRTAFELLDAKLASLTEQQDLMQRDLYRIYQVNHALLESNRTLCTAISQLFALVKETHPQFNFGLGAKMSDEC